VLASLHAWVHWPDNAGYNFISGPFADMTLITGFGGALVLWLRKHNCHIHGCWRMEWHVHPDTGHPVCKRHHPQGHSLAA